MTHEPTLNVSYSCKRCRTIDREVAVRARRGEAENIKDWMEDIVLQAIYADHRHWAPACRSEICNLKIPLLSEFLKS